MIFSGYGKLLGKIVEYACSVSLKTTYHGIYNGPMLPVNQLSARFSQNPLFINEFQGYLHAGNHCPIKGTFHPPYDFIDPTTEQGLSVKSIMDNSMSKVSPSVIGQPSTKKFCQIFDFHQGDEEHIKYQVTTNIDSMMPLYFNHTFSYPILFYHAKKDICMVVKAKEDCPIPWNDQNFVFSHQLKNKNWVESSSISMKKKRGYSKSVGEFQFHRNRDCIKFRFSLSSLLEEFPQHFLIQQW